AIESLYQCIMQRLRNSEHNGLCCSLEISFSRLSSYRHSKNAACELLYEQRHAVRLFDDLIGDFLRDIITSQEIPNHAHPLATREPSERVHGYVRMSEPRGSEFWPERYYKQNTGMTDLAYDQFE